MEKTTVKTSEKDWLERALQLYKSKESFTLIDDANIGLTEKDVSSAVNLMKASVSKGKKSLKNIVLALTGLGFSGVGVYLIIAAIMDPEPTSKLGLIVSVGGIMAVSGSLATFASLGIKFSVKASTILGTFEIKPK